MKVILRKNYDQLGQTGDIVEVKNGFAMNFLIPRQIAFVADKGNIRAFEEETKQVSRKQAKELESAKGLAEELGKISVTIPVTVGEEDKIFGTVTPQMISESLASKGYDIDKRKIEIPEQIKALGIYTANIKLHHDVTADVKTWVVRE